MNTAHTYTDVDDIRPLLSRISIPSGVRRVAVPLDIVGDTIVEDVQEYVTIRMTGSPEQQSLFVGGAFQTVSVTIVDNDSKYFAFRISICTDVLLSPKPL